MRVLWEAWISREIDGNQSAKPEGLHWYVPRGWPMIASNYSFLIESDLLGSLLWGGKEEGLGISYHSGGVW